MDRLTAIFGQHAATFAQQLANQAEADVVIVVGQAWHDDHDHHDHHGDHDVVCFAKPTGQLDQLLENSADQLVLLVWNNMCVLDERWQEFLHRYDNVYQIVVSASTSMRGALVWQADLVVMFGQPNQPGQPGQPNHQLDCVYQFRFKFDMTHDEFYHQMANLNHDQALTSHKPANQQ